VQHTDPAEYERELRRTPNTLQHNAAEIARVKLAKTLSARRTVAFLLDPRRNYAVLEREEWNATGQRVLRVESDQWTLYEPPGIWLPGRCVVFYYARPTLLIEQLSTHPIHVQTNRLTTVEFERKGISFTFEPGEPAGLPEPK
jgi:hypothetical protein